MYNGILDKTDNLGNDETKQLTVAFPLFGEPSSFINKQNENDGLLWKMWSVVWENMQKEKSEYTNIKPVIKVIENPSIEDLVQGVYNKTYDVVIGDFAENPERSKYVNFSSSFMSVKDVGVYLSDYSNESIEYALLRKIMNILYYPLLILIVLSILFTIYANFSSITKNTTFFGSYLQMFNAILGDKSGLINGSSYKIDGSRGFFIFIFGIIVVLGSFLFLFYIQSVSISKSLDLISKNKDPFAYPEGKKVLIMKGSNANNTLRDCCNMKPIESNSDSVNIDDLAKEFLRRYKKEKLIGFYGSGNDVQKWIKNHPEFIMSSSKFSSPTPVCFMVSKYKPALLYDINKSIHDMRWNGTLNEQCQYYINRLCYQSNF